MTAGVVFVITAIFIGVAAWAGLALFRSRPGSSAPASAAPPGQPEPATPPGGALNATQMGDFLILPTQPPGTATPGLAGGPPAATRPAQPVDLERLLAEMPLEDKIGQMIMTGVPGQAMSAEAARLVEEYHFGSVVYFGENTANPAQVGEYSRALQQAAAASGQGIPLLISVDHEGGRVFRFKSGMTHFPNPMALGAARSADLAFRTAAANAAELASAGVNLDLAPVLDVNDEPLNPVIGLRAFGGFPDLVSEIGVAYIRGLQQNGVLAAAKHFPGHGSTTIDSHAALPVVNKSPAQLEAQELAPFKAAVEAGVGVVMVGHVAFPQIDPSGAPASLSPLIVQTLLRDYLGYDGVVMTDAMSMGAVVGGYSLAEAAVMAVDAGCDLVAYTSPEAAVTARGVLLQSVRSGRLSEAQVDASVRRILALKARAGLFAPPAGPAAFDPVAHAALVDEIARQSVNLVGAASLPLIPPDGRVLLVTPDALPVGSQGGDGLSLLGELLTLRGVQVDEWIYPLEDAAGTAAIQAQALAALERYPQAVVVAWDARLRQEQSGATAQVSLVRALQDSGKPVLLAAASSPFDLALLPANGVGLATYGGLEAQIEALAEALLSPSAPPGALPVPLAR